MRHRYKKIVLNKSRAHTKSVVRSLVTALIKHGRITTTAAKAKILKQQVETLISKTRKREQVHAIREANKVFFEKEVAKTFFSKYIAGYTDRESGYVRTYKLESRKGDNAPMVLVELIEPEVKEAPEAKAKKAAPTAKKEAKTATTKKSVTPKK